MTNIPKKAVQWALNQIGCKYSQAQRTQKDVFDCSSLVARAYSAQGKKWLYILSLYRAFPWLPYDPDDIIQEVYFCLYEKRKKIYDPSGLKSWLIKTTQNKTFDVGRDYVKRYKIIDRFVEAETRKGESNIVAGFPAYNFGLYMELCEQKIGKKNMEMLQRYYVDKESIKIIAKEAGVAVPIMRMRFHRWKKYCAQIIRSVIRADLMLIIGIAIYKNSIK